MYRSEKLCFEKNGVISTILFRFFFSCALMSGRKTMETLLRFNS